MLNGFCVSGFCLSMLSMLGTFYVYVEEYVPLDMDTLEWFSMFHDAAPILFILGFAFSVVGIAECRKHEQFTGKGLGIAGLVLAVVSIAHYVVTLIVY